MEFLWGPAAPAAGAPAAEAAPAAKAEPAPAEVSLMSWLIGCGGGSQVIDDTMGERMVLCGTGVSSSRDGVEPRDVAVRARTASYDEGAPPRLIVLGGADRDQTGGVGRDLVIPRGALGSVVLNNVRPSVFDDADDAAQFAAVLPKTAAAIISVDTDELYWTVVVRRWADRLRATRMPVALLVENEGVNETAVNHHVSSLREAFANPFVGVFFKNPRRDETAACVDTLLRLAQRSSPDDVARAAAAPDAL